MNEQLILTLLSDKYPLIRSLNSHGLKKKNHAHISEPRTK